MRKKTDDSLLIQSEPVNLHNLQREEFEFTQLDKNIYDQNFEGKPVGFLKDAMTRFIHDKAAIIPACILLVIVIMSIIGTSKLTTPYTYKQQDLMTTHLPPRMPICEKLGLGFFDGSATVRANKETFDKEYGESVIQMFGEETVTSKNRTVVMVSAKVDMYEYMGVKDRYYWFGTDQLGRDLWTRTWRGVRISLIIAFSVSIINLIIGSIYGAISGYFGGSVDMILQRVLEVIDGIPYLPLLILCIVAFGASIPTFIVAMCLTGWTSISRLVRAQFYRYKGMEYVLASRTMGAGDFRLMGKHIFPNAVGPLITSMTLAIPGVIFSEAILSYIGIGLKAPEPSIGILLNNGQQVLLNYPHVILFPAILICVLMLSFNLAGNGLRDAFDPTQRGR